MATESGSAQWNNGELTELEKNEIREGFRRWEKDTLFFDAHQTEWREKYTDMYVAIYREELVCAAPTIEEIYDFLESKNIPGGECYCQFLSSRSKILAPANRMRLFD